MSSLVDTPPIFKKRGARGELVCCWCGLARVLCFPNFFKVSFTSVCEGSAHGAMSPSARCVDRFPTGAEAVCVNRIPRRPCVGCCCVTANVRMRRLTEVAEKALRVKSE